VGSQLLVVNVTSVATADPEATLQGPLYARLGVGAITDARGLSFPSYSQHGSLLGAIPRVPVGGSWTPNATAPAVVSVTALDTAVSHGFTSGDSIVVAFNVPLNVVPLSSVSPSLFQTNPPLPPGTGVWNANGRSLLLTFVSTQGIQLDLNDTAVRFNLSVLAAAGITTMDPSSLRSTSWGLLTGGSWGVVPSGAVAEVIDTDTFRVHVPVTLDARVEDAVPSLFKVSLVQDCEGATGVAGSAIGGLW